MKKYLEKIAKALLRQPYKDLNVTEKKVIESIADQKIVSENVNESYAEMLTFGQRLADKVASFGGSWKFIGLFFLFIFIWIGVNSVYLSGDRIFDPYPFILLNLGLSTLAAFQAPIIMMSQNRQAAKDRIKQDAMYEINLKLELEIMRLHDKLDTLSDQTEKVVQ